MKVEGDEKLIRALKAFPDKLARKVLRKAGSKAATPVARAARKLVRPTSKTIATSIGSKVKVYPKSGRLFVAVGPKRDTPKSPTGHNPSKTAHLVDRGTKPHRLRVYGRVRIVHPGARPRPFLEPAEKQSEAEVKRIFIKELHDGVERTAKELE